MATIDSKHHPTISQHQWSTLRLKHMRHIRIAIAAKRLIDCRPAPATTTTATVTDPTQATSTARSALGPPIVDHPGQPARATKSRRPRGNSAGTGTCSIAERLPELLRETRSAPHLPAWTPLAPATSGRLAVQMREDLGRSSRPPITPTTTTTGKVLPGTCQTHAKLLPRTVTPNPRRSVVLPNVHKVNFGAGLISYKLDRLDDYIAKKEEKKHTRCRLRLFK